MSRRFGRNQKRKMRAEIAHVMEREAKLSEAYWREQDLMVRMSKDNEQLRETINLTEKVLGAYFATLPPKTLEVNEEIDMPENYHRMDYPRMSLTGLWDRSAPLEAKLHFIDAAVMNGETWVDELKKQMHISFRSPAGEVRYGFSPNAFNNIPRERVVTYIAENMAEFLTKSPEFNRFVGKYMQDKRRGDF